MSTGDLCLRRPHSCSVTLPSIKPRDSKSQPSLFTNPGEGCHVKHKASGRAATFWVTTLSWGELHFPERSVFAHHVSNLRRTCVIPSWALGCTFACELKFPSPAPPFLLQAACVQTSHFLFCRVHVKWPARVFLRSRGSQPFLKPHGAASIWIRRWKNSN